MVTKANKIRRCISIGVNGDNKAVCVITRGFRPNDGRYYPTQSSRRRIEKLIEGIAHRVYFGNSWISITARM